MSHNTTTQHAPQWAIDAASEIESWHIATSRPDISYVATIIARHAPAECRYTDPTAEIESRDARIAELAAENARLNEYKYGLSYALRAVDNLLRKDWTNQFAVVLSMAIDIELGRFIADNNLNKDWNQTD